MGLAINNMHLLVLLIIAVSLKFSTASGLPGKEMCCGKSLKGTDCKCSDVELRANSCARAYLEGGCNKCNPLYTDLKGHKTEFPPQFNAKVEAIKVRMGCTLTIYGEEDFEGDSEVLEGTFETWNGTIGSYECDCGLDSFKPKPKPPRPECYPSLVDIPGNLDSITALMKGPLAQHPGLLAAKKSLKSGRSPKNAYILVLGSTGSGKSSTIDRLFYYPNISPPGPQHSSSSSLIYEYRLSVPVDELGINNSELRIIDVPGFGDTRGVEQDAVMLATLDDYFSSHEELNHTLPTAVLIVHRFSDNRFPGQTSLFVRMLQALENFRGRITDDAFSNVIFVLSHFCSETEATRRQPAEKIQQFKSVIEKYTQFPKPIVIALAENKGEEWDLPMINGHTQLPNGDLYPKNLYDKIQALTAARGDTIGEAVTRTAFRDPSDLKSKLITRGLVERGKLKIGKYLQILTTSHITPTNTEITLVFAGALEKMNSSQKLDFSEVFHYLIQALRARGIRSKADMPTTPLGVLQLLAGLQKSEILVYALQHGLGLTPPIFESSTVTGYGYNLLKDSQLTKSPYVLGEMINSDIGFLFPSTLSLEVIKKNKNFYHIVPDRAGYLKLRMSNLGINEPISPDEFKVTAKPGYNVANEQFLNGSCVLTAVREFRTFELTLNPEPKLTLEFKTACALLPTFNQSDSGSINHWKAFFKEFGTHVVKSAYGGGSIEITVRSDEACGPEIAAALLQLIELADDQDEDLVKFNNNSTGTFEWDGISYALKFNGGDSQYHIADLTNMTLDGARKLLREWRNSLRLKPTMLTTEMKWMPLSSVKFIGQITSAEIQKATSLLFNSTFSPLDQIQVSENPID